MTDLFVSKKISFKDFLFSLDLYKFQMSLYYKNNFRQSSYLGLLLSFCIYAAIIAMAFYFLSSSQYTLIQVNESSYKNTFNPFQYPIGFAAFDNDTKSYLSEEDFTLTYLLDMGFGKMEIPFMPCKDVETFSQDFGKRFEKAKKNKDWEYFLCGWSHGENITSNSGSQQNNIKIYPALNPSQIIDNHRNVTLKILFLMDYLDDSSTSDNIIMKEVEYDYDFKPENTFELDVYFTQNTFKVKGNLLRKSQEEMSFYYMDEINLIDNQYEPFLDDEGYTINYLTKVGTITYRLFQKRPQYEKNYPSVMDVIGIIGGWMNIVVMITNCFFNFLIANFIKLDLIKTLTEKEKFDSTKISRLNTSKCRFSAPPVNKNKFQKMLMNNEANNSHSSNKGLAPNNIYAYNNTPLELKENYQLKIKKNQRNKFMNNNLVGNPSYQSESNPPIPNRSFSLKDVDIKVIYYFIPFAFFINKRKNSRLKYLDILIESTLSVENVYRLNKEMEFALKVDYNSNE